MKTILRFVKLLLAISMWIIVACIPPQALGFNLWEPPSPQEAFWHQLRDSFDFDHYTYRDAVYEQICWFQRHQRYLQRILTNAAPYLYYIYTQVRERNLPGELVLLPVIESEYDPFAYSNRGAAGLWQLMPGTATGYGLKEDWWYDGRRDIFASTNAALGYLTYLRGFFNGNWLYAIAAYDAGEGTIQQAINFNAGHDLNTDFWALPLPHETDIYVPRLLALAAIISDPERYGVHLPTIRNEPFFAAVNVGTQIDLAHAAKLAGISLRELYRLNPGFNRWATDPDGPYRLLLPVDRIGRFERCLANLPVQERITLHRYRVRLGDTLSEIAHEFRTRVNLLQEINKLHHDIIQPGQVLIIPHVEQALNHSGSTQKINNNNDLQHQTATEASQSPTQLDKTSSNKINQSITTQATKTLSSETPQPTEIAQSTTTVQLAKITHSTNTTLQSTEMTQSTKTQKLVNINHTNRITPVKKVKQRERHYHVRAGDNLGKIANDFGISIGTLKRLNHLHSDLIHPGQRLQVPPA